jgi:predicted dehydrogenase
MVHFSAPQEGMGPFATDREKDMKKHRLTRRAFLAGTTTASIAAVTGGRTRVNAARVVPRRLSPNEKMNVAAIGSGGKGLSDIMNCRHENVVALCDADHARAGEAFYRLKGAKHYWDYRKMLEEMGDEIDACTISTPDHTHAPAAYMAMMLGKHVYVQKPLTHTIAEARLLRETARAKGAATQMGNQGQSMNAPREVAELIESGVIGSVKEVHVWTDRPGAKWVQGIPEPLPGEPVRDNLNWDLWIGSAPFRPYNIGYCPRKWRGWWDFGCGALGDMGCHNMNPAWFALKLGEAKSFTVELIRAKGNNDQTGPLSSVVKYSFPARGDLGPVDLYWYEGGETPAMPEDLPADTILGKEGNGSLFVGDGGYMTCNVHGEESRLLPEEKMQDWKRPAPAYARIPEENHCQSWIDACKGGKAASSNFEYSGPLTEMVNFGNLVVRTGGRLAWDAEKFRTDSEAANALLTKEYREGWEIPVKKTG